MNTKDNSSKDHINFKITIWAIASASSIVSLGIVVYHAAVSYENRRIAESQKHLTQVPTDSTGFTIESRMPFYSFKNMPVGSPNPKFTASLEQSPEGLVHFDLKLTNGNWLYLSWDGQNPPSVYTGGKDVGDSRSRGEFQYGTFRSADGSNYIFNGRTTNIYK